MTEPGWSAPIVEIAGGASRVLFVVLALTAGLLGGLALLSLPSDEMRAPGLIIAGLPAAALGAIAWQVRQRATARRLRVHDEGVQVRDGDQVTALRFDEIEAIEVKTWQLQAAHVHGAGIIGVIANAAVAASNAPKGGPRLPYDATQVTVTLHGAGRSIQLRKWDPQWVDAYRAIRTRVEPRLLARARAQLAQTGTAQFGPIAIGAADVRFGDKAAVPVSEIENVAISPTGVTVKRRGQRGFAGNVRLSKVPNVHVMIDLIRERSPSTIQLPA
jgi:hypothetical protein